MFAASEIALRLYLHGSLGGDHLHWPLLRVPRVHLNNRNGGRACCDSAHHDTEHSPTAANARRIGHARGRDDGLSALLIHALHDGDGLRPAGKESSLAHVIDGDHLGIEL